MAINLQVIDRLKSQLLTSGTQEQNNALFQVINQLIETLREVAKSIPTIPEPEDTGGGAAAYFFRADTTNIAANDPGAGRFKYNNATQASATRLFFDWLTDDDFDIHILFELMEIGNRFVIQDADLAVTNQIWELTGPAINHPDWFEVPVVFVSGGATFTNNQRVAVLLAFVGGGGGSTGIVIGDPIVGGTPNTVLINDAAGKLANTDSPVVKRVTSGTNNFANEGFIGPVVVPNNGQGMYGYDSTGGPGDIIHTDVLNTLVVRQSWTTGGMAVGMAHPANARGIFDVYVAGSRAVSITGPGSTLFPQAFVLVDGWTFSPLSLGYREISAAYNQIIFDVVLNCTGTFAITLVAVATRPGRVLIVKNSGAGIITLTPNGTDTIETSSVPAGATLWIQAKATGWITIDSTGFPPTIVLAHHATHEFGGTDEIVNAAWKDRINVFTRSQVIAPPSTDDANLEIRGSSARGAGIGLTDTVFDPVFPHIKGTIYYANGELNLEIGDGVTYGERLKFFGGKLLIIAPEGSAAPNVPPELLFQKNFAASDTTYPRLTATPLLLTFNQLNPGLGRVSIRAAGLDDTPLNASNLASGTVPIARLPTIPTSPHHATHETGGTDAIVALDGSVINSGTVADARLSSNVALENVTNVFTQNQTINKTSPIIDIIDSSAPPNSKVFRVINTSQLLIIQATDDALSTVSGQLIMNRGGDFVAGNRIFERARSFPIGEWNDIPYNAANFASDTGTWDVPVGSVGVHCYSVVGKTMTLMASLTTTTITGTPSQLWLFMPAGFSLNRSVAVVYQYYNGPGGGLGFAAAGGFGDRIQLLKDVLGTAWAAGTTHIWIQIVLSIT
jgi:hypothetical protein